MNQASSNTASGHSADHSHDLGTLYDDSLALVTAPRWKKVIGDLWGNKIRTVLVVLSIFVGVFAVGLVIGSGVVLSRELRASFTRVSPAHATITTGSSIGFNEDFTISFRASNDHGFSQELVEVVRHMYEVEDAEGRHNLQARVKVNNHWQSIKLVAINDFDDMRANIIQPQAGLWPPPDKQVLIERSGMTGLNSLNASIGDVLVIERPDGKRRTVPIAGTVSNPTEWPTTFMGTVYGYVTFDTMEWFGENRDYNEMIIRVADPGTGLTKEYNEEVARKVYDKIRDAGLDPSFPKVPQPDSPPLQFVITSLISLMAVFGIFAIVLSGFLVTNTISALLAQQIKQIGMMKAVGARPTQIMMVYIVLVVCFGMIALVAAIPLAQVGVAAFAGYIAAFFNFDIVNTTPPTYVAGIQAAISLLVPVIAALIPVYSGTSITIRQALSNEDVSATYGTGMLDSMMQRIRGLPRPVLLSLRNTFRRKGRVALTLLTLTLGGAFFIAVFSSNTSLQLTVHNFMHALYNYDIDVFLHRPYHAEYLKQEALRVPGVVAAEPWLMTTARRVYADKSESLDIQLYGTPPDVQTMNPIIQEGRWLVEEDEHALVVSTGVRKYDPDIQVGSELTLKIKDRDTTWRVVGIVQSMGESRMAYASYDYASRAARETGDVSYLRVITSKHDLESERAASVALERHFKQRNIDVSYTKTMIEMTQGDQESIAMITFSLMLMAILVAVVGGLGLAGTMSLNVIERMREIGVMRAIGASDMSVLQVFIVEGVFIGAISWLFGTLVALPVSFGLCYSMGMGLFSSPLDFSFSLGGVVVWLVLSLVIATVASFVPAWRATRVSVRQVLAYE